MGKISGYLKYLMMDFSSDSVKNDPRYNSLPYFMV